MRSWLRVVPSLGLGLWMSLGCGNKGAGKPTREECAKVSEHIADLIVNEAKANPDTLWDAVNATPGDTGIPATVTKPQFKAWLDGAEGQTWMMQRRGQTLAGTQNGIESCVAHATRDQTSCLLKASSKSDVEKCDRARQPKGSQASAGSGSATGSGSVTGNGSAEGGSAEADSAARGSAAP